MTTLSLLRWSTVVAAALVIFAAAPDEDPRLWRHRVLGKALFENPATMDQAVAEFKQAVELAPQSVADRLNYGIALLRAGDSKAAIAELEKVETVAPELPHVRFNLGLAYKRQERLADAIREFEALARLVPAEPVTYFQLGMLFNLTDRPIQALENFQKAALLDEKLVAPRFQIYDIHRLAGDAAAARALADFHAVKSAMEAAGESEDMDWCFYAELYDPAAPRPPDRGAAASKPPVWSKKLLGRIDPASAGLALIDAFGENRTDLLAWSRDGVRLYRAGLRPVSQTGLEDLHDVRWIAPGDFDNDGLTDLCVVTAHSAVLYRNRRGRFERAPVQLPARAFESAIWLDFDHDYDLDLILLGEQPALLRNEGSRGFADQTTLFPFVAGHAIGAVAFRLEPDTKSIDLAVAYADRGGVLYRDRLRGQFQAEPLNALPAGTRAIRAADLDGDSRIDLQFPAATLLNHAGKLEYVAAHPEFADAVVSMKADFNGDGREDSAFVGRDGSLWLLTNRSAVRSHWLGIGLAGVKSLKTALGAEVEVKAGGHYEKRQYEGVPLLFNLGAAGLADVVRITWPNGLIQNEIDTRPDRYLVIREAPRLAGSCPTVFTWNGRGFQFIGDVLGVAPLGVSSGDGTSFPVDTDEYLQIPPGALVSRDGRLEVRITEELHEVSYIDQASLVAVDHPAGIVIVTNEKFKAPPFPEFRLFGVTRRIDPVSAHDDAGRDQLPALLRQDRVYAGGFRHDSRGVAAPHSLEMEFPAESAPENRAVLILSGWIDWADGSTFLAASQTGSALTLPYLQTKGDDGVWRTVIPDMGVPSGGPKTIAVDLTGKFAGRSRAIRIVTNACVYWDRIFLSEDTAAPPARVSTLDARAAGLALRGFSAPAARAGQDQPESFDYAAWRPYALWNPVPGKYTRYGDVRELLNSVDDRFVIMGSGDELRLGFDERGLPPLRPGWARDFLLYVDGWSKDADANTAASGSVEPLPFHAMTGYPYPAAQRFPDDEAHQAWREQYNTRPSARSMPNLAPFATRGPRVISDRRPIP